MIFIKDVSNTLKDSKRKSIILLVIYFIFFIFVFIIINTSDTRNYTNKEYIDENNNILSYEYIYRIYDDENMITISGKYKDGLDTFIFNGNTYTSTNNQVYLNGNLIEDFDLEIYNYRYEMINLLIENSDSQTIYKDSNKITYNINILKYFELLSLNNNCNIMNCASIEALITIEKDKYMNQVLIDLSNYYGYDYKIQIDYNNVNQVF